MWRICVPYTFHFSAETKVGGNLLSQVSCRPDLDLLVNQMKREYFPLTNQQVLKLQYVYLAFVGMHMFLRKFSKICSWRLDCLALDGWVISQIYLANN